MAATTRSLPAAAPHSAALQVLAAAGRDRLPSLAPRRGSGADVVPLTGR